MELLFSGTATRDQIGDFCVAHQSGKTCAAYLVELYHNYTRDCNETTVSYVLIVVG